MLDIKTIKVNKKKKENIMDLVLAPKNMPSVTGNFDKFKEDLIKQIEEYKAMPLTEDTVAPIKSAIRQKRTTLEKIESTAISAYFETPKKELKATFAELYAIIAEGESKVDEIIAEETRKRNDETTKRFIEYVKNKIKNMALEKDAVSYVLFHKQFYNKSAKEAESLNDIDAQLATLEKNFAAYIRAEKKINKCASGVGAVFDKDRFLHRLSKYGEGNDETAAEAEEEAERILAAPPKEKELVKVAPVNISSETVSLNVLTVPLSEVDIRQSFPVYDRKKSKGSEEIILTFTIPKEMKKSFNELLKNLKEVGITNKKQ